MNKVRSLIGVTVFVLASAFTVIKVVSWKVKDGYSIKWDGATFKGLKASILFDEENPEKSKISAYIDARTINSGNGLMDEHAREALAVDKFPWIIFTSTAVSKAAGGYEATGNLTLKGVTKKIKFFFMFDSKNASNKFPFFSKETFKGSIIITPKDFNVTREGTPSQVTVELVIPVTQ